MYRIVLLLMMLTAFAAALLTAYARARGWQGCPDWPTCFDQWPWDDWARLGETAQRFAVELPSLWCDNVLRAVEALLLVEWVFLMIGAVRQTPSRWPAVTSAVALLALILTALAFDRWDSELPGVVWLKAGHGLVLAMLVWSCGGLLWYNPRFAASSAPRGPARLAAWGMGVWCVQLVWGLILAAQTASTDCQLFALCPGTPFTSWLQQMGWAIDPAYTIHLALAILSLALLTGLGVLLASPRYARRLRSAGGVLFGLLLLQAVTGHLASSANHRVLGMLLHHALALTTMLWLIYVRYAASRESALASSPASEVTTAAAGVAVVTAPPVEVYVAPTPETLLQRLTTQLQRTRSNLTAVWQQFTGDDAAVQALLDDLEAHLIRADVGVDTATHLIERLRARHAREAFASAEAWRKALQQELLNLLAPCEQPLQIDSAHKPYVILVVGVNGVGKTTTIGKLAKRLQHQGHSVMLAAGDTFRAAAVEQLQTWGERNQIPVVAQHTGADAASVIFDALQSARAKGIDVLIADTAGRLHTKSHLMEELKKIKRIIAKLDDSAPHEVLLVVDAGTGQNALSQAKLFNEAVGLTGMALTKLDGTAKGGVIFALARHMTVPIRYIGVGEGIDDLQDFHAQAFIDALFASEPPA